MVFPGPSVATSGVYLVRFEVEANFLSQLCSLIWLLDARE